MRLPQHRALIALLLAAALAVTWLRPLDALAERHVEAGLKRALIAFASARTLNAVLSALQTIALPLLYVGFLFWLYRALTTARFAAAPRLPA